MTNEDKHYVKEVKMYGAKLDVYNLCNNNKIDETKSIIKYQYCDQDVYLLMSNGECTHYFKKKSEVSTDERTKKDFLRYELVRKQGLYNMYTDDARSLTGLTVDRYLYIMNHYTELYNMYISNNEGDTK